MLITKSDRRGIEEWLRALKPTIDAGAELDVRLQVFPEDEGGWTLHTGDSCYDQDHRGYWGSATIDTHSNCVAVAGELIEQVLDQQAEVEALGDEEVTPELPDRGL